MAINEPIDGGIWNRNRSDGNKWANWWGRWHRNRSNGNKGDGYDGEIWAILESMERYEGAVNICSPDVCMRNESRCAHLQVGVCITARKWESSKNLWGMRARATAIFNDEINESCRLYLGETTSARINETKKTKKLDCNLVDFGRKSRFFNQSQWRFLSLKVLSARI